MAEPIASGATLFEQQILEVGEHSANLQRGGEETNPNGVTNFITGNTYDDNNGIYTATFNVPYQSRRNPETGIIEKVALAIFEDPAAAAEP